MSDNFEEKLRKLAENGMAEPPKLPEGYDEYIEDVLKKLPDKRRKHLNWKGAAVLAAALTAMLSITVTAAVNYVSQRMEQMEEEEKSGYYAESLNISPSDSYSRELTQEEEARMQQLADSYQNQGLFPEGELARISDSSEYDGTGVAFLASHSTFFLPQGTLSDEELLQIIDYRAKREYTLNEAARKAEAGETQEFERIQPPAEKPVDLKAEDLEIAFTEDTQLYRAAASADTIYIGNGSQLYQIDAFRGSIEQMNVQVPEGMEFSSMAADTQGNLCILLEEKGFHLQNPGALQLWKIAPDGRNLKQIDLTALAAEKNLIPQALAVDSDGNYYISSVHRSGEYQYVYVLDENGGLIGSAADTEQCSDTRALGRGKNGKVYGIIMKGEEWIPGVVEYDAENGSISREYKDILPHGVGAYTKISAGTDTDLLIWGTEGVYSYSFGDDKAQRTTARYDLPDSAVLDILPDGRAVFVRDELLPAKSASDTINARTVKIYLIKVG